MTDLAYSPNFLVSRRAFSPRTTIYQPTSPERAPIMALVPTRDEIFIADVADEGEAELEAWLAVAARSTNVGAETVAVYVEPTEKTAREGLLFNAIFSDYVASTRDEA